MPKTTNEKSIARLLSILKCLPSKGDGITARELTDWLNDEGYAVSKRTIERDLNELSGYFPLIRSEQIPFKWRWMEGKGSDLPSLTVAEALSLTLVEDLLRSLLPSSILGSLAPRFGNARRKLEENAETSFKARWADKVRQVLPALPLLPPKISDGVLESVQDALLSEKQLQVAYKRPDAAESQELRLHPLGFVQRGPVSYLVATVFDYTDIRIFAVHRIQTAKCLVESSRRPDGFSLDDYIGLGALHFGGDKTIRFSANVTDWMAKILSETPLSGDQQIKQIGDDFRLTATVADTWQLRWWILSLGHGITVLKPLGLRQEIIDTIEKSARNYT